jgi:hypothetical protein
MRDLMLWTDGWLTDWTKKGGRFKEWIRSLHLSAINHGWIRTLADEPGHWFRSARHILSWVPILWDDHDFDGAYLLIIIREKLRRMRADHERHKITDDWETIATEILEAETLLDRIIEDDYFHDQYEYLYHLDPLRRAPIDKDECDSILELGRKAYTARQDDLDLLFKQLRGRIDGWWN